MSAMRMVHGFGKWLSAAALVLLMAAAMACQSSSPSRSNLSEYEKLVAKRRALSATPMSVRAQQEAEARKADDEAAARRAAEELAQQKAAEEEQARIKTAEEAQAREEAKAAEEAKAREEAKAAEERRLREAEEQARRAEEDARKAAEAAARKKADAVPPVQVLPAPVLAPAPEAAPKAAPAAESSPSRPSGMSAYTLGVGDAVQIYLRGIPQQDLVEDIIDEAGMVSVPFINEIRAAGLTASDLEQTIRNAYIDQKIYRNITVQVIVPTRFYYVQGAARSAGRSPMQSAVHVSEAIAAAGGGTDFWSGRVYIRRNGAIFKDIKDARKLERTPEDDILLEPGDIVELRERFW